MSYAIFYVYGAGGKTLYQGSNKLEADRVSRKEYHRLRTSGVPKLEAYQASTIKVIPVEQSFGGCCI